jgi:polar amino acid transport system substrate-binding protein
METALEWRLASTEQETGMTGGRGFVLAGLVVAATMICGTAQLPAQPVATDEAKMLAPTGKLRVGVLMVWYFAVEDKATGELKGIIPDLGGAFAARIGVPIELIRFANPAAVMAAFRNGALDVTFIGITADRAEAMDYGPTVIDLQTTFLVPAASKITSIAEIDQPGLRILVPQRSAQEAHLRKIITKATLINVAVETPKQAVDLIAAGEADAFSHVVPMLASAQPALPGSRILPGSYYDVPVAVAVAKGRPAAAAEAARRFVEEAKASGLVKQAIERAGVGGVVVSSP